MSKAGTLERLLLLAGEALQTLSASLKPEVVEDYLADFGIALPDGLAAGALASPLSAAEKAAERIAPLVGPLRDAVNAADSANAATLIAAGAAVAAEVAATVTALNALGTALAQAAASVTDANTRARLEEFAGELAGRILGRLLLEWLDQVSPQAARLLAIVGLTDDRMEPGVRGDPTRHAYYLRRIRLDRLGKLVTDPAAYLREVLGWGTPDFDVYALLERVRRWFRSRGELADWLGETAFDPPDNDGLDFHAMRLLKDGTQSPPGLAAELSFSLAEDFARETDLGETAWTAAIELQSRFEAGLRIGIAPDGHLTFTASDTPTVKTRASLRLKNADQTPIVLLALAGGSRLEARSITLEVAVEGLTVQPSLRIAIEGLNCVLDLGNGDSFLQSMSGGGPGAAQVDVAATWSPTQGLQFTGAGALEIAIPSGARFGPATIETIHLAAKIADGTIPFELSAGLRGQVGPLTAIVDRVGAEFVASFPKNGGNLGAMQFDARFKPPSGVGLSVDAAGVTGGGFLFHDAVKHLYAGVMQLSLVDQLTVTAFGLISARMPDGGPGYSLLVFITAEDFRPIPLGLGFTLQAIGGMIAVNRTFDEAALRAGVQNDSLRSLLFPRDPVANAPTIINALATAFPARNGSYLLGIVARIGWGTPTLIQFDLALILEFGARNRLLALGRITALLPSPDNDLLRLKLDAIGVLDLDQGSLAIDAFLVDSRLAHKFALTGAGALRAGGAGGNTGFVLAVGGFNPRFAPPPGVPALPRVAIALSSGKNPRLTCEAYFALTSNTIQFGARAQLHAEAYGFSVDGDIGFDVLISRSPLHFIADFHASMQLKRGSHNLFKVSLQGSLEGPRPLRVSGKASFEIFWCDFTVRFDKTLIDGDPPPLPPAIDVQTELLRALSDARSWRTDMPASRTHGVALRRLAPGTALVIDPLGRLVVTQDVVPLNTGRDIETFGGSPVAGARRFALGATLNGVALTPPQTLQAAFAPAQFFQMSDDEKLAAPSFETMDAGMAVGSDAVSFDTAQVVAAPLEYESIVIDTLAPPGAPPAPLPVRYALDVAQLQYHSATGAAARAPVRRTGRDRFRPATPGMVRMSRPDWAIVPIDSAPPVAIDPAVRTWSEHRAALDALNRGGARYQLVPAQQAS